MQAEGVARRAPAGGRAGTQTGSVISSWVSWLQSLGWELEGETLWVMGREGERGEEPGSDLHPPGLGLRGLSWVGLLWGPGWREGGHLSGSLEEEEAERARPRGS